MNPTTQRILVGDARDLAELADGSVHLVVTSPPYPMVAMWDELFAELSPAAGDALASEDAPRAYEAMHLELDRCWAACHRVLAEGGHLIVNVGDATRRMADRFRSWPNHARIIQAAERLGFDVLPDILWRKPNNSPTKFLGSGMLPPGAHVTYEHEYVLVLRKGAAREVKAVDRPRRRASAYFWEERNLWFSDLWTGLAGVAQEGIEPEIRERTAAFPLEVPLRLVQMFSMREDVVLDPFAGLGTTLAASALTGRSGIAVEREASLAPLIEGTLRAAVAQGDALVRARLDTHLAFVAERAAAGKPLAHANGPHGFAVMTAQESDLELVHPSAITSGGEAIFRVSHVLMSA